MATVSLEIRNKAFHRKQTEIDEKPVAASIGAGYVVDIV